MNTASPSPGNARRRGLTGVAIVVTLVLIAVGGYWYWHARYYENTDDAYVAADIAQVGAEVGGTVQAVLVDDTQRVTRGQLLVELDPADAQLALDTAEADLARVVRKVRGLYAQTASLQAQIDERQVSLQRAQSDLARRAPLRQIGGVSAEELAHAHSQIAQLQAALSAAREQMASMQAQTEGTTVATHPDVLSAEAAVRQAALALQRTRITAPVDGVVARRGVQVGMRVAAGTPLMAVVPLERVWVDANFKEVQLASMRAGQPVLLHADLYGAAVDYHGHVAGLAAGSGAAFALLPPQNASGNWIKIVQRVPVRIELDAKEIAAHPLRVGLSMRARVDTRDRNGGELAPAAKPAAVVRTSAPHDAEIERRIADIVERNAGVPADATATP